MSTIPAGFRWEIPTSTGKQSASDQPLHRVAQVRQQQGLSLRSVARQTGVDVRRLRQEESEDFDLRLSDLYRWQQVLGVPLQDLLEDPGMPLSSPVLDRARLVRIMKTVRALQEKARTPAIQRMTENLVNQLLEVMPELLEIGPWHSVGQRRSLGEYGRAAERLLSEETLYREWN